MDKFDHSTTTDQFLINLHQYWCLAYKLHGTGSKMIRSLEEELDKRNIKPEPYEWTPPREYESMEGRK